jgi:hypothetical protein
MACWRMTWTVQLHPDFDQEMANHPPEVQEAVVAAVRLLQQMGPHLKRPHCDTLKGSQHANMKELRFDADDGVWRVAFAFDPNRQAILLVGGDKSGTSSKKFYKALIRVADERFNDWLEYR